MDMEAREGNIGYQLDIYECLEIVNAEAAMVDRQRDAGHQGDSGSGSVHGLHLLRQDGQVDQA